jgi:dihydrofolate reductase
MFKCFKHRLAVRIQAVPGANKMDALLEAIVQVLPMAEANGMQRRRHSQVGKRGGRTSAAQRKIIVYIATSADGYIARLDGSVDWLNRPMPKDAYGMTAFARSIDTILWGRKTYDFAAKMGGVGAYGKVKHYAFSRQPPSDPLPGVEFVSESIPEFVSKLHGIRGKNIWMMGGAGIIASFLDAGAIDEFSIHIIPVMTGEGIPLVAPRHRNIRLELISRVRSQTALCF